MGKLCHQRQHGQAHLLCLSMTSPRKAALLTIPTVGGLLYLQMVFFLSPFFVIAIAATIFAATARPGG
jgi:hypothetical protein